MSNKNRNISYLFLITLIIGFLVFMFVNFLLNKKDEVPVQKVFQASSDLNFILDIKGKPQLKRETVSMIQKVSAQENHESGLNSEESINIDTRLTNLVQNELVDINFDVTKQESGTFLISSNEDLTRMTPGKYRLEVDIETDEGKETITQDFNWGVLAINTNKSIYLPNETAYVSMAVLDERGEMVCNAKVDLEITDPEGNTASLSTTTSSIKINPDCNKKEYVPNADYETKYNVLGPGIYKMSLTATTKNGIFTVDDSFEVWESVPYDIERVTATRIYPPVNYPVIINVKANKDFSGVIQERIPTEFDVVSEQIGYILRTEGDPAASDSAGFVQKVALTPLTNEIQVTEQGKVKLIEWYVDMKEGEEYQLKYVYKAPEISPEFYLLGPLSLIDSKGEIIFKELRRWQIAADAINYVQNNTNSTANTTSVTVSLTPTSGNVVVFICTVSSGVTITGPVSQGFTEVHNSISGGLAHATYYKVSDGTAEDPVCSWTGNSTGNAVIVEYSGIEDGAGHILDASTAATGSGDATAECPTVPPTDLDTHLYLASLGFDNDSNILAGSWTSGFIERVNFNSGVGGPPNRHITAVADTLATGSWSTTATAGGTGDWSCHMLAFNENSLFWDGIAYTDDDEVTPLTSTSVCGVINAVTTPYCALSDGSGNFSIEVSGSVLAGDAISFYLEGGTDVGNCITVSDGLDIVSPDNLRIYEDHVIVRHEYTDAISISDMVTYDNDDNSVDMLFTATTGATDTLTVETGNELFVQSGFTFEPLGDLTQVHDIEIEGIWMSSTAASENITLNGSFNLDLGGSFEWATSVMTFNGSTTEDIFTLGTGGPYDLILSDSGAGLVLEVEDPLTVYGDISIIDGTLDAKNGEGNQITLYENWDNDDTFEARTGLVLFANSAGGTTTLETEGTGNDAFYDLTFDSSSVGTTFQITTVLDADRDITITSGTLASNGFDIYVGRSWTNDSTFVEGTNTVIFDNGFDGLLDSGCVTESTCTDENFYNILIDKSEDAQVALTTTNLRVTNTLSITEGELLQGALNMQIEGGTAIDIGDFGRWTNISTGNVILGGSVNSGGIITLNGNGLACGDADDIAITSTSGGTQRSWNGNGAFRITDVNVTDMTGTAVIHAGSSTISGQNNGANWVEVECNIFEFEGLEFEDVGID